MQLGNFPYSICGFDHSDSRPFNYAIDCLKGYCHRHAHTTMHAPWTKDHALIFGPKNQRVIIPNGHDPNRAADVETPICIRSG